MNFDHNIDKMRCSCTVMTRINLFLFIPTILSEKARPKKARKWINPSQTPYREKKKSLKRTYENTQKSSSLNSVSSFITSHDIPPLSSAPAIRNYPMITTHSPNSPDTNSISYHPTKIQLRPEARGSSSLPPSTDYNMPSFSQSPISSTARPTIKPTASMIPSTKRSTALPSSPASMSTTVNPTTKPIELRTKSSELPSHKPTAMHVEKNKPTAKSITHLSTHPDSLIRTLYPAITTTQSPTGSTAQPTAILMVTSASLPASKPTMAPAAQHSVQPFGDSESTLYSVITSESPSISSISQHPIKKRVTSSLPPSSANHDDSSFSPVIASSHPPTSTDHGFSSLFPVVSIGDSTSTLPNVYPVNTQSSSSSPSISHSNPSFSPIPITVHSHNPTFYPVTHTHIPSIALAALSEKPTSKQTQTPSSYPSEGSSFASSNNYYYHFSVMEMSHSATFQTNLIGVPQMGDSHLIAQCPKGHLITNISGKSRQYVNQIIITCSSLQGGNGITLELGSHDGSGGALTMEPTCLEGYVAARVRNGTFIGQLDMVCSNRANSFSSPLGLGAPTSTDVDLMPGMMFIGLEVYYSDYLTAISFYLGASKQVTAPKSAPISKMAAAPISSAAAAPQSQAIQMKDPIGKGPKGKKGKKLTRFLRGSKVSFSR